LGLPVRLVGKVGDDAFGGVILDLLRQQGAELAEHMVRDPRSTTSYTVVISPPGIDRLFLHHSGANDTCAAEDIKDEHLSGGSLCHFGYPTLMKMYYSDGGAALASLLRRAKAAGLTTSLDVSFPDPESEAGLADWPRILGAAMQNIDFFFPSLDEIAFMLKIEGADPTRPEKLREIAGRVLQAGAAVVAIKLGDAGLYLKSTADGTRLERANLPDPEAWRNREMISPCFPANVVGATGAGDCTIGGFLAALHDQGAPEVCMTFA